MLVSGVLRPFRFLVAMMTGRALASAVAMPDAVSLRVVPAWLLGMQPRPTIPWYRRCVVTKGLYLSCFSLRFLWQPKSLQKPISKGSESSFAVEGVDVRGRVDRHSSGVDDVGDSPRSGCHQAV